MTTLVSRRLRPRQLPARRWSEQVAQYEGPFQSQYRAALDLLKEVQVAHEAAEADASTLETWGRRLTLGTAVLAAVAGISSLPGSLGRVIAAITAFGAALIAGTTSAYAPERRATEANARAVQYLELRYDVEGFLRSLHAREDSAQTRAAAEKELGRLQQRRTRIGARKADPPAVGEGDAEP